MYVKWNMSRHCGSEVEVQQDRGYTLRGRRIVYVSPALSRRSGDCTRVTTRVPGGSATENDDRGGVDVVPESPARIDDFKRNKFHTWPSVKPTYHHDKDPFHTITLNNYTYTTHVLLCCCYILWWCCCCYSKK